VAHGVAAARSEPRKGTTPRWAKLGLVTWASSVGSRGKQRQAPRGSGPKTKNKESGLYKWFFNLFQRFGFQIKDSNTFKPNLN
jgi:hypothetical protein